MLKTKNLGACKIEGCDHPSWAKEFCKSHYSDLWRGVRNETGERLTPGVQQLGIACKMEGCTGKTTSAGFCNRHYLQMRKGHISGNGQRLVEVKERNWPARIYTSCKVVGCDLRPRGRGFCSSHYARHREGLLDADGNRTRENNPKGWQLCRLVKKESHGYLLRRLPSHPNANSHGYVFEHRLLMERILGRYLEKHEIVHHRDGNRENNAPENLELMTQAEHPPAHEWTRALVLTALEALRHNDPEGYDLVMGEQDKMKGR